MGWEDTLLKELGREKSESYRALYMALGWFLTVTLAIGAIVAKDMGELPSGAPLPVFWVASMVAIIIITARYYSRAMNDYVNMQVWSKLFNRCGAVLLSQNEKNKKESGEHFKRLYATYVCDWNSIIPRRKIVSDTLDMGYGHLIFLELCLLDLIVYKMSSAGQNMAISISLLFLILFISNEVYWFFTYRRFKYVKEATAPRDIQESKD